MYKRQKLNIGNLASFDFQVPEEIQRDMILNLPNSAGYSDSKGIFAARKAVMHYTQELGIRGVTLDDIYLGNGASDLISLATNALLDLLTLLPNGVQRMSPDIEGLVQTSLSLGIVETQEDSVRFVLSIRSSLESEKQLLADKIGYICLLYTSDAADD